MEVREKYIARVMNSPEEHGFTNVKFVHTPQLATASWVRLRCQYTCRNARKSDFVPPFSPTVDDTIRMMEEYKFGLLVRREEPVPLRLPNGDVWSAFQDSLIHSEQECATRGYGKAFALAVGNCLFCHHDDSMRPCDFNAKKRPTLEAIGFNMHDTLKMLAWEHYLVREPGDPMSLFGLLLLE